MATFDSFANVKPVQQPPYVQAAQRFQDASNQVYNFNKNAYMQSEHARLGELSYVDRISEVVKSFFSPDRTGQEQNAFTNHLRDAYNKTSDDQPALKALQLVGSGAEQAVRSLGGIFGSLGALVIPSIGQRQGNVDASEKAGVLQRAMDYLGFAGQVAGAVPADAALAIDKKLLQNEELLRKPYADAGKAIGDLGVEVATLKIDPLEWYKGVRKPGNIPPSGGGGAGGPKPIEPTGPQPLLTDGGEHGVLRLMEKNPTPSLGGAGAWMDGAKEEFYGVLKAKPEVATVIRKSVDDVEQIANNLARQADETIEPAVVADLKFQESLTRGKMEDMIRAASPAYTHVVEVERVIEHAGKSLAPIEKRAVALIVNGEKEELLTTKSGLQLSNIAQHLGKSVQSMVQPFVTTAKDGSRVVDVRALNAYVQGAASSMATELVDRVKNTMDIAFQKAPIAAKKLFDKQQALKAGDMTEFINDGVTSIINGTRSVKGRALNAFKEWKKLADGTPVEQFTSTKHVAALVADKNIAERAAIAAKAGDSVGYAKALDDLKAGIESGKIMPQLGERYTKMAEYMEGLAQKASGIVADKQKISEITAQLTEAFSSAGKRLAEQTRAAKKVVIDSIEGEGAKQFVTAVQNSPFIAPSDMKTMFTSSIRETAISTFRKMDSVAGDVLSRIGNTVNKQAIMTTHESIKKVISDAVGKLSKTEVPNEAINAMDSAMSSIQNHIKSLPEDVRNVYVKTVAPQIQVFAKQLSDLSGIKFAGVKEEAIETLTSIFARGENISKEVYASLQERFGLREADVNKIKQVIEEGSGGKKATDGTKQKVQQFANAIGLKLSELKKMAEDVRNRKKANT